MKHDLLHLLAMVTACASYALTVLFASGAFGHHLGFLMNITATLADRFYLDKYDMDVTPASETFYMTGFIYIWQSVWLSYACTQLCRSTQGSPLYTMYPVIPPILYVVFSFSLACNVSWLLIWDREYMEVALVFINLMTCTLYICLVVSLRRLNEYGYHMARQQLTREIWLIRVFVHNGIAMFASWGTVASIFNFAVVLTYRTGAKKTVGSIVSLTILTMEIVSWWIFDTCIFDRLLRYLCSPYIVVIISLTGILARNWDPNSLSAIYTAALLTLTIFLTTIKLILMVYRHRKCPIFSSRRCDYRHPEAERNERTAFVDMTSGNVML